MFTGKIRLILIMLLSLVTASALVTTVACTPAEADILRGVLKNVDSVNGEVTIVTKDGKTVTVKIVTETEVAANGTSTSIETLEPGVSIDVEVKKDGGVARHIEARQAETAGIITAIKGNEITIEIERGNSVTIRVTDSTRIKFEDDLPGTLADLRVGMLVETKFDPSTRLALKIKVEEDEEEEGKERSATATGGWGIIEIRVTDPPPADVKSAVIYLKNVEVHKVSGNASDNASGWIPIIRAPPSFDLMDIIEVTEILGSANVTAGRFTQIRMDVDRVEVVTTDNVSYTAEVPGDKLKIVGAFNVGGGGKTILTLDFDGKKSLIITGNGKAGKVLFKPVVKLLVNNEGKGSADNRGESNKGQSGENGQNEGKGNSDNASGKND